jgi:pyruvate ferredoxin oxidoreductase alpha subunit
MGSMSVIKKVFAEFKEKTNREYNIVEKYDMDDAEVAIIALGSTVESARVSAKEMRGKGVKAGIVAIRVLRPFPHNEIMEALSSVKAVASLDRSSPNGAFGMLYNEISGAMYHSQNRPVILNYIYGLGGRDMKIEDINVIYNELDECVKAGEVKYPLQQFIGLRGPKLSFF